MGTSDGAPKGEPAGQLAGELDAAIAAVIAESGFVGVVRIDAGDATVLEEAHGLADRAHGVPHTAATRFGVASIAKGFTALVVMRLVETAVLALDAPVRRWLGSDLPLIDDAVTVEQLLAMRSGIGDYLDEDVHDDVDAFVMPVPVHQLDGIESYLAVLDGFAQVSPPGEVFVYNNGGFVVLSLVAERAAGMPFADLVAQHVTGPAGLTGTRFERSDELPGDVAIGYLGGGAEATAGALRSNLLHLPIQGSGDGGITTSTADLHALWAAIERGDVVAPETWRLMTQRRSTTSSGSWCYGWGVWLRPDSDAWSWEGCDAGASARTVRRPSTDVTWTVLSNTSMGAWPLVNLLHERLA